MRWSGDRGERGSAGFCVAAWMSAEFEMQINPKSVFHSSSVESQICAAAAPPPVTPLIIHSLIPPTSFLLYITFSLSFTRWIQAATFGLRGGGVTGGVDVLHTEL